MSSCAEPHRNRGRLARDECTHLYEIGTGGAPVSTYFCVVDKGDDTYVDLFLDMWYDFSTNVEERNAWVTEMERLNGPYSTVALTSWRIPGKNLPLCPGQSFRKAEADGLANPSRI